MKTMFPMVGDEDGDGIPDGAEVIYKRQMNSPDGGRSSMEAL